MPSSAEAGRWNAARPCSPPGLGVRKLAAQLGTDTPVFPNKSQVMLLERIPADVLPIPLLGIAVPSGAR